MVLPLAPANATLHYVDDLQIAANSILPDLQKIKVGLEENHNALLKAEDPNDNTLSRIHENLDELSIFTDLASLTANLIKEFIEGCKALSIQGTSLSPGQVPRTRSPINLNTILYSFRTIFKGGDEADNYFPNTQRVSNLLENLTYVRHNLLNDLESLHERATGVSQKFLTDSIQTLKSNTSLPSIQENFKHVFEFLQDIRPAFRSAFPNLDWNKYIPKDMISQFSKILDLQRTTIALLILMGNEIKAIDFRHATEAQNHLRELAKSQDTTLREGIGSIIDPSADPETQQALIEERLRELSRSSINEEQESTGTSKRKRTLATNQDSRLEDKTLSQVRKETNGWNIDKLVELYPRQARS